MPRLAQTLPREISSVAPAAARQIFVVLTCDSPAAPSVRASLQGIDQVLIRRGALAPGHPPVVRSEGGELTLAVADDRMSSEHAVIRQVLGKSVVEDAGSRNGTLVNGRRVQREVLADGDVIELGHTFLIYRTSLPLPAGGPPIEHAAELRPKAPGFGTLLPTLGADLDRTAAVARTKVPVVIRGETGTGKELIASAIHGLSGRDGPFVAVNCAGLPPSLVQSELLGHCKGAFMGATEDSPGLVRSAQGGTLYLDGVEDLPPQGQALLLRVLEQSEVFPVGGSQPVAVDVRILASTQRDLEALVVRHQFRGDLLARLSGLSLQLPPLRERREDLGLLIRALLRRQLGDAADAVALSCEAARALFLYRWPLNVRELEKALQAAVVLAAGAPVGLWHLPAALRTSPARAAEAPQPVPAPGESPSLAARLQHFVDEVGRRRVARVLVAYSVAVFGALQGADVIVTRLSLPPHWMTWIVSASLAGLPLAGVLAWIFDWTREGIVRTAPLSPDQRAALAPERRWRRRRLILAVGAVALLTIAGAAWWRNRLTPARPLTPVRQRQ